MKTKISTSDENDWWKIHTLPQHSTNYIKIKIISKCFFHLASVIFLYHKSDKRASIKQTSSSWDYTGKITKLTAQQTKNVFTAKLGTFTTNTICLANKHKLYQPQIRRVQL